MKYIKIEWIHNFSNEPIKIYSELDDVNNELRKIEVHRDGTYGYADNKVEFGGSMLSIEPLPSVKEIDSDKQFKSSVITKTEFEAVWYKAVNYRKN